jgi:hypothetical protein
MSRKVAIASLFKKGSIAVQILLCQTQFSILGKSGDLTPQVLGRTLCHEKSRIYSTEEEAPYLASIARLIRQLEKVTHILLKFPQNTTQNQP